MYASLFSSFSRPLSPLWWGRAAAYACGWMYYPRVRAHNALLPECVTPLDLRAVGRHRPLLCAYAFTPQVRYCFFKDQPNLTHTPEAAMDFSLSLLCVCKERCLSGRRWNECVRKIRAINRWTHLNADPGMTILLFARSGCNFAVVRARYHGSAQHIKCLLTSPT